MIWFQVHRIHTKIRRKGGGEGIFLVMSRVGSCVFIMISTSLPSNTVNLEQVTKYYMLNCHGFNSSSSRLFCVSSTKRKRGF